jgi:hypothetical protein
MSAQQIKPELHGKTIESAAVLERPSGDAEFVMRFTDGSTATVAAWKREGHSLKMNVDLVPNATPQTDGGTHRRRV